MGPTISALNGSFLGSMPLSILGCLSLWLVCWKGGRLGKESLYFLEGFYLWVSGWGGLRVEVDPVLFSHIACGILVCVFACS